MSKSVKLSKKAVSKAVDGLFVLTENTFELVDVPEKISLMITFKKIPQRKKATTVELKLPKSTTFDNQSVCLFVKDLDKDDREYEKTKYFYQDMFKTSGLSEIPDIIPIKSLLLEYKSYEAKKNLSNMYDVYLADSRIAKVLPRILGKHFYGRKKIPKRVIMTEKPLKNELENAINRCNYIMSMRGSCSMVSVAHRKMKQSDVVANIMAAVKQISEAVPGGAKNIRNLYIRTAESEAIPLYISLDTPNDVEVKNDEQEIVDLDEPEEITTLGEGHKVQVTKTGDILIYSKEGKLLSVSEQNILLGFNDMESSERRALKRKANKAKDPETITPKSKRSKVK